jgi:dolichyl-diphosphooligosaccharide--protein glycosyltransferase
MVTSGAIYHALRWLTFPVDIRNICVLLAPGFSGLTAFASYLLTSEMSTSPSAGLLAAIFMGIAPGYISRSVAGSYDNEAIAIFLLVFTFYLWIKAVKVGSVMWGGLTALFYGYMVSAWVDSAPGCTSATPLGTPSERWPACRFPSSVSCPLGVASTCLRLVCSA